jgi:hypothetical protein
LYEAPASGLFSHRKCYALAATRQIAARLRSTSSALLAHDVTLIRIAARPCHAVPPHQLVPAACTAAITRRVRASSPNATTT